jgi:phosphomannomutase
MPLKFGTSGVRGLVTEMTDKECYLYTAAFAHCLLHQRAAPAAAIAGDHRSSTPRILTAAAAALTDNGFTIDYCGLVPTPTVAAYARKRQMACIMVTGSHIPDDRNGIKYYMPRGETLKSDEGAISKRYRELKRSGQRSDLFDAGGRFVEPKPLLGNVNTAAIDEYIQRYIDFFPPDCLSGMKLVFYQHSAVIRTSFAKILESLGAEVVCIGWSDAFVPVDTEAVKNSDELRAWTLEHRADALLSADGDSDRPLLVDEAGNVVRGDVLGIIASDYLRASVVATPVSCNTAVEKCGRFKTVIRTRIGSPYVIAAMQQAEGNAPGAIIVGYEANGGYLTQTDIPNPDSGAVLPSLPTRDAVLPVVSVLCRANRSGRPVSQLVAELPPRFTHSGLLRAFPSALGQAITGMLEAGGKTAAETYLGDAFGAVESMDHTDGARITFDNGRVVHFRPSGNAPEFRCYTEAETVQAARTTNDKALEIIETRIRPDLAENIGAAANEAG